MKIITWYEVILYTNLWKVYDNRAYNSLEAAKQEMERFNQNSIIKKRKTIIWGKYEILKKGR